MNSQNQCAISLYQNQHFLRAAIQKPYYLSSDAHLIDSHLKPQNYQISQINILRQNPFLPALPRKFASTSIKLMIQRNRFRSSSSTSTLLNCGKSNLDIAPLELFMEVSNSIRRAGSFATSLRTSTNRQKQQSKLELPFYNNQQPDKSSFLIDSNTKAKYPVRSENIKQLSSSTDGSSSQDPEQQFNNGDYELKKQAEKQIYVESNAKSRSNTSDFFNIVTSQFPVIASFNLFINPS